MVTNLYIESLLQSMKLQRQKTKVKGREYSKWVIIIPPKDIEKLGWKEGEELEGIVVKCGYFIFTRE